MLFAVYIAYSILAGLHSCASVRRADDFIVQRIIRVVNGSEAVAFRFALASIGFLSCLRRFLSCFPSLGIIVGSAASGSWERTGTTGIIS